MFGPSFKPTHNMYIYFAQEGTIFCYSTKNVPNVGESFLNLPVCKPHLREQHNGSRLVMGHYNSVATRRSCAESLS